MWKFRWNYPQLTEKTVGRRNEQVVPQKNAISIGRRICSVICELTLRKSLDSTTLTFWSSIVFACTRARAMHFTLTPFIVYSSLFRLHNNCKLRRSLDRYTPHYYIITIAISLSTTHNNSGKFLTQIWGYFPTIRCVNRHSTSTRTESPSFQILTHRNTKAFLPRIDLHKSLDRWRVHVEISRRLLEAVRSLSMFRNLGVFGVVFFFFLVDR